MDSYGVAGSKDLASFCNASGEEPEQRSRKEKYVIFCLFLQSITEVQYVNENMRKCNKWHDLICCDVAYIILRHSILQPERSDAL